MLSCFLIIIINGCFLVLSYSFSSASSPNAVLSYLPVYQCLAFYWAILSFTVPVNVLYYEFTNASPVTVILFYEFTSASLLTDILSYEFDNASPVTDGLSYQFTNASPLTFLLS